MEVSALQNLGVSDFLIAHLEEHEFDSDLGYRCQPPHYWMSSPIAAREIVPLWECGTTLTYHNPSSGCFEACSLEEIDKVHYRYKSLQSVLAVLFLDLFEDDRLDDGGMRDLAVNAGFSNIDRLLDEAVNNQGDSYCTWRNQFPGTCS